VTRNRCVRSFVLTARKNIEALGCFVAQAAHPYAPSAVGWAVTDRAVELAIRTARLSEPQTGRSTQHRRGCVPT
jgi:hypothetical protein